MKEKSCLSCRYSKIQPPDRNPCLACRDYSEYKKYSAFGMKIRITALKIAIKLFGI